MNSPLAQHSLWIEEQLSALHTPVQTDLFHQNVMLDQWERKWYIYHLAILMSRCQLFIRPILRRMICMIDKHNHSSLCKSQNSFFYSSLIIANHCEKSTHKYTIYERFFIIYKLYIITQIYRLISCFHICISLSIKIYSHILRHLVFHLMILDTT